MLLYELIIVIKTVFLEIRLQTHICAGFKVIAMIFVVKNHSQVFDETELILRERIVCFV